MTGEKSANLWIKGRRSSLDLTQEELAECVGCSAVTIQKIESGERRPSKQIAEKLAMCLMIPPDECEAFLRFARGEQAAGQPFLTSTAQRTAVSPPSAPNNLPRPLMPLIGREDALAAACDYLVRKDVRLLTLTGVPGIGKTRLSLDIAAQLLSEFQYGVFFVELASVGEPDLVASTIVVALGYKGTGSEPLLDGLKQFISDKRMLLVLDNFEQVLDAAPVVIELLRACPALKVLVTSREALHTVGEQQIPVPPLEVPDLARLPDTHDEMALLRYPAVALFVQRACAVDPSFVLTSENHKTVAAICTRLEGLPLAIELAAARIKMLTPVDLLFHLDQRLKLLTGGPRHLPARLQTLRGAIDWSYRLLNPAEQGLFSRLGIFVGGATLSAIQAIYNEQGDPAYILEGVGSLIDKNLLLRQEGGNKRGSRLFDTLRPEYGAETGPGEPGRTRFAMLEMIREYATEKLVESGEAAATERAHALFFLRLAEETRMKVWGPEETRGLDCLEEEHDNLRAAFHWCLSAEGSTEIGLRLVVALGRFWEIRGYFSEGRERIASVLSRPEAREQKVKALRARALLRAAALAFWQSDYPAVLVALEEALAIFQELGDKEGIARALIDLGDVTRTQGNYDTASLLCQQALAICRELDDTDGMVVALALLGWAELRPGYYSQATEHLEEALVLARQLQVPSRVALVLSGLGEAMGRQGEYEQAIALLEESLP